MYLDVVQPTRRPLGRTHAMEWTRAIWIILPAFIYVLACSISSGWIWEELNIPVSGAGSEPGPTPKQSQRRDNKFRHRTTSSRPIPAKRHLMSQSESYIPEIHRLANLTYIISLNAEDPLRSTVTNINEGPGLKFLSRVVAGYSENPESAVFGPTLVPQVTPEPSVTTMETIMTTPTTDFPKTTAMPYGTVNICYVTDALGVDLILSYGFTDPTQYFDLLTSLMNQVLMDLDPHLRIEQLGSQWYSFQIYLSWFNGNDYSTNALINANSGFWDSTGIYLSYMALGCDVAFYTSPWDYAFDRSNMVGVGNMHQMCTRYGHGIFKQFTDIERTAILAAHELGHLLGIYHDGYMESDYEAFWDFYPELISHLFISCEVEDSLYCPQDETGTCIMNPSPYTNLGPPRHYSNCSRAYYNTYRGMAADFPTWYDISCFQEYFFQ